MFAWSLSSSVDLSAKSFVEYIELFDRVMFVCNVFVDDGSKFIINFPEASNNGITFDATGYVSKEDSGGNLSEFCVD